MSAFTGNRSVGITASLCAVQFVDVLGVTAVVTALPRMLADLDAGPGVGSLIVTAYALLFGGLLLPASRWGRRFGHRRCVVVAVVVFAVGALVGAVALEAWMLVAARAVQGVAAAVSVPAALFLITTHLPEGPVRRRGVAAWSAAGAAAGVSGFLVGGVVTEVLSWRAVLGAMVLVGAVLAVAVLRMVPPDPDERHFRPLLLDESAARPDRRRGSEGSGGVLPSAVLLLLGVAGLVVGPALITDGGHLVGGLFVVGAGVVVTVALVLRERRVPEPLVPADARRSSALRRASLVSFVNTATTSASFTVVTLHLQRDLGFGPLQAAGLLVGLSVLVVVGSALAPTLVAATGLHPTTAFGLGAVAAGNLLLVGWSQPIGIAVAAAVCGLGLGLSSVAANELGTSVPAGLRAVAAGALNTAAQLGAAVGTAALVLVATLTAPRAAWLAAAGIAALTAVAAVVGNRGRSSSTPCREE